MGYADTALCNSKGGAIWKPIVYKILMIRGKEIKSRKMF